MRGVGCWEGAPATLTASWATFMVQNFRPCIYWLSDVARGEERGESLQAVIRRGRQTRGDKQLASASVSASKLWLGLGLGLKHLASVCSRRTSSRERTNLFALYFADYRTSHYDRRWLLCKREWEINFGVLVIMIIINSPVCCQSSFDTFYS